MRVAQSLLAQGKNKEAIEMLDIYIKYFPDSKVPFDMYMLPYAEVYYRAGATEKANKLVERVAEIYGQNIDYYYSFSPANTQYFEQDVQTALGIIKRMSMIASQNNQPKLAAKIDTMFNMKINSFK